MDKELAAPVKRHLIMRPKTTGGGGRPLVVVPTIGAAYRPSALMPVKPLSAYMYMYKIVYGDAKR